MTLDVQTLSVSFNLPLQYAEINQWRGAFIEMGGWQHDLFHNHQSRNTYTYRYPLIHYRVWKKRAAIFALSEGVEAFSEVLAGSEWEINWQGKRQGLCVEGIQMQEHQLQMSNQLRSYRLHHYVALNKENYLRWKQCHSLLQRALLIENILTGHILGFCTAMGYRLPERLEVSLQSINHLRKVQLHGNSMLSFSVNFDANVELPHGIALGRGVSTGFGRLSAERSRQAPGHNYAAVNRAVLVEQR